MMAYAIVAPALGCADATCVRLPASLYLATSYATTTSANQLSHHLLLQL